VIAYSDTSAVVPLVVAEPGSSRAIALWGEADRVVSVRLVSVEGRAALAQAHRLGRITTRGLRHAVAHLVARCDELDVVEVDRELVAVAGELAERHRLRGCDAVHLAAALRLRDADLVVVAGDDALVRAAHDAGIATAQL
jgi:predicted nucleic acid-binding protein